MIRISISAIILDVIDEFKASEDYNIVLSEALLGANNIINLNKNYEADSESCVGKSVSSVSLDIYTQELLKSNNFKVSSLNLFGDSELFYHLLLDYYMPGMNVTFISDNYKPKSDEMMLIWDVINYHGNINLESHSDKLNLYFKSRNDYLKSPLKTVYDTYKPKSYSNSKSKYNLSINLYNSLSELGFKNVAIVNAKINVGVDESLIVKILENKNNFLDLKKSSIDICVTPNNEDFQLLDFLNHLYNLLENSDAKKYKGLFKFKSSFTLIIYNAYNFEVMKSLLKLRKYFNIKNKSEMDVDEYR